MAHDPNRRKATPPASKEGPVRPGTPLHRLLELIAREIAKDLQGDPDPLDLRPEDRPPG